MTHRKLRFIKEENGLTPRNFKITVLRKASEIVQVFAFFIDLGEKE